MNINLTCQINSNNTYSKIQQKSKKKRRIQNFGFSYKLPQDLYFIDMAKYNRNDLWAQRMLKATTYIANMIKNNKPFNIILNKVEETVANINFTILNRKTLQYGIRKSKQDYRFFSLVDIIPSRGIEYYNKYQIRIKQNGVNSILIPKANYEYKTAITSKIQDKQYLIFIEYRVNNPFNAKSNLDLVEVAYNKLKSIKMPKRQEIINTAATIQWLIAQETPYLRGSDSVANLLTRSLIHSYNIELSSLKPGRSCDFEAFYTNLDDYTKIYPLLFKNNLNSANSF